MGALIILLLPGCKLGKEISDLDNIQKNEEYIKNVVIKSIKVADNYVKTRVNLNKFESNSEIIEYIIKNENKLPSNKQYGFYLPTSIVKEIEYPYENEDVLIIDTSLPIIDIENKNYYIKVFVTSFKDGEPKALEDYYFKFRKIKKNNTLKYVKHLKTLNIYNVGPPIDLPKTEKIDTVKIQEKLIKIDSLIKLNSNKIKNKQDAGISGP